MAGLQEQSSAIEVVRGIPQEGKTLPLSGIQPYTVAGPRTGVTRRGSYRARTVSVIGLPLSVMVLFDDLTEYAVLPYEELI
jgi:hypothetical protein